MQGDKVEIYLHFIWTTWDRLPLITPDVERKLHDCLASVASDKGCRVLAINGVSDHVHLLLGLPPTLNASFLVQQMKGISSHLANESLGFNGSFKWRGSYAVFSVSRWDVKRIARYIRRQKERHAQGKIIARLETEE